MKQKIRYEGTFSNRYYKYTWLAESSAKHDVSMYTGYIEYILMVLEQKISNQVDLLSMTGATDTLNCSFQATFKVPFNVNNRHSIDYFDHYSNRLTRMEEQPTPPRHVWDKKFPSYMQFVVSIIHKVKFEQRTIKRRRVAESQTTYGRVPDLMIVDEAPTLARDVWLQYAHEAQRTMESITFPAVQARPRPEDGTVPTEDWFRVPPITIQE